MDNKISDNEFDVIVIGSGICGSIIARELSKQNKKVLILERGKSSPLTESLMGIVAIANEVPLGDKSLSTVRAITTGGSTGLYFGVVNYPALEAFAAVGIDLTQQLKAVKAELPIAQVPESLLNAQAKVLRDSASSLGYAWQKNDMLIDLSKCPCGYAYEAKWKARSYVEEAILAGSTLITQARVHKVIMAKDVAIGVEYTLKNSLIGSQTQRAFATKIVLSAGELASPGILRNSGIKGVGTKGFYCNPGYAIYGLVPGLQGTDGFVGSMGGVYEEDIELGDANVVRSLHRPMMLGRLKFRHLFAFAETVGVGVKVKDGLGGQWLDNGRFCKTFDKADYLKLEKGKQAAIRLLQQAGAKNITDFGITAAGRVGGLVRIQEHLNEKLETQYRNLHVCDGSVIPDIVRGSPSITLACLAKYLSKHLLASL